MLLRANLHGRAISVVFASDANVGLLRADVVILTAIGFLEALDAQIAVGVANALGAASVVLALDANVVLAATDLRRRNRDIETFQTFANI